VFVKLRQVEGSIIISQSTLRRNIMEIIMNIVKYPFSYSLNNPNHDVHIFAKINDIIEF